MVMSTLLSFLVPSTGIYPVEQFVVLVHCPCQYVDPIIYLHDPFRVLCDDYNALCHVFLFGSPNATNYDKLMYFLSSNNL